MFIWRLPFDGCTYLVKKNRCLEVLKICIINQNCDFILFTLSFGFIMCVMMFLYYFRMKLLKEPSIKMLAQSSRPFKRYVSVISKGSLISTLGSRYRPVSIIEQYSLLGGSSPCLTIRTKKSPIQY